MDIPRRDVDFGLDPDAIPVDWCNGDAFESTLMNALSLLFPEGEKFFVDAVKQQQAKIADPLRAEVVGFVGQEAMHGREHRAFNQLLVAHGYSVAPGVEHWLRGFLKRVRKTLSPMSQLAATCALEHFTAMLAEMLLTSPRAYETMDAKLRELWLWHALEESEHKAVAFDVYQAAGGGYMRRVSIMMLTTLVFFAVQAALHFRLMVTRGIWWQPWRWVRGSIRMWIYPGFFIRQVPKYLAYFRPGFHPTDRDTTGLLATWREKLFGPAGELAAKVAA